MKHDFILPTKTVGNYFDNFSYIYSSVEKSELKTHISDCILDMLENNPKMVTYFKNRQLPLKKQYKRAIDMVESYPDLKRLLFEKIEKIIININSHVHHGDIDIIFYNNRNQVCKHNDPNVKYFCRAIYVGSCGDTYPSGRNTTTLEKNKLNEVTKEYQIIDALFEKILGDMWNIKLAPIYNKEKYLETDLYCCDCFFDMYGNKL